MREKYEPTDFERGYAYARRRQERLLRMAPEELRALAGIFLSIEGDVAELARGIGAYHQELAREREKGRRPIGGKVK